MMRDRLADLERNLHAFIADRRRIAAAAPPRSGLWEPPAINPETGQPYCPWDPWHDGTEPEWLERRR